MHTHTLKNSQGKLLKAFQKSWKWSFYVIYIVYSMFLKANFWDLPIVHNKTNEKSQAGFGGRKTKEESGKL